MDIKTIYQKLFGRRDYVSLDEQGLSKVLSKIKFLKERASLSLFF